MSFLALIRGQKIMFLPFNRNPCKDHIEKTCQGFRNNENDMKLHILKAPTKQCLN
jgi:hypothetical protein